MRSKLKINPSAGGLKRAFTPIHVISGGYLLHMIQWEAVILLHNIVKVAVEPQAAGEWLRNTCGYD